MGYPQNQSYLAQPVLAPNFTPILSAKLTTSGSSTSVTFTGLVGAIRTTFAITNSGATNGAYIGWGAGSATAVASGSSPAANCHYIPAGATRVLDFQVSGGVVDTIAAIQSAGATTLEITLGFGQA